MLAGILEERAERRLLDPDPEDEDPRWTTMQYLMQVYLKRPPWETEEF